MKRLSTFDHALVVLSVKNYAQNKRGDALVEKLSAGYIWIAETDAEDALLIDASTDITQTEISPALGAFRFSAEETQTHFDSLDAARGLIDEKQIPLALPFPTDRNLDSDIAEDR